MVAITLPDGSKREFAAAVTVADVAADIGAGLAKAALAGRVDGKLVDLSHVIDKDAQVAIITGRDAEGVEIIRHSTAHLMAQAVKEAAESAGPQNMQLSMFQLDDPVLVQIRDQIKGLDINSLTPIEALNKLNEIKKITGI